MPSGHDIAMGLRSAYWSMHRRTSAALARHSVTADQLVLLSLLVEEDGISQQELVRRTSSDPNTIRAMLVRMEQGGLVLRRPHPTDGRAKSVQLTAEGDRVHGELAAAIEPLRALLIGLFPGEQAAFVVECLRRVSEAMAVSQSVRVSDETTDR